MSEGDAMRRSEREPASPAGNEPTRPRWSAPKLIRRASGQGPEGGYYVGLPDSVIASYKPITAS